MELSIKPKIKEIKPKKVVYVRSIGAYGGEEMGKAWAKLFEFIKQKKIFSFGMESVGISYDNPEITESEKCRYDACVSIKKKVAPEGEIGVQEIPVGKYAILGIKGHTQI